jgi:hypothetical protein
MNEFEPGSEDPTIPAINEIINTMGGAAIYGQTEGNTPAPIEAGPIQAPAFGSYRRPFKETPEPPKPEQKAAGAAFSEAITSILEENDAQADKLIGGHELRCRGIVNGQERHVAITKAREGMHVVFSTDKRGSGERYSYMLGSGGEVRRVDKPAPTAAEEAMNRRAREETQATLTSSREERAAAIMAMIRQAQEHREQITLEARMGTNNLPVSFQEVQDMLEDLQTIVKNRVQ